MPGAISTNSKPPPASAPSRKSSRGSGDASDARPPPILRLPTELLHEIVRHLGAADFLACRLSCSRFLYATEFRSILAAVCHGSSNSSGGGRHRGGGNSVSSDVSSDGQSLASLKQRLFRRVTDELPPFSKCLYGLGFLYRSSTHLYLHSHSPPVPPVSPSPAPLVSLSPVPAVFLAKGDATFFAVVFQTVVYVFVAFSLVPMPAPAPAASENSQMPFLASPPTMVLAHQLPGAALSGFYASQGPPQPVPGSSRRRRLYVLLLLHADETAVVKVGFVGDATQDTVLRHPCHVGPTETLPHGSLRVRGATVDAANWRVSFDCAAGAAVYWIRSLVAGGPASAGGSIAFWKWFPHPAAGPAQPPPATPPPRVSLPPHASPPPHVRLSLPPITFPPYYTRPPSSVRLSLSIHLPLSSTVPTSVPASAPVLTWQPATLAAADLCHPPHQSALTVANYAAVRLFSSHLMGAVHYRDGEIRVFNSSAPRRFDSAFLASEPTVVQLGIALRRDPRCGHRPAVAVVAATTDARLLIWHLTAAPFSRSAVLMVSEGNPCLGSSTSDTTGTPYSRLGRWRRAVAARLPPSSRHKGTDEGGARKWLAPVVRDDLAGQSGPGW